MNISSMSASEMIALQNQLEEKVSAIRKKIRTHHHKSFIDRVGLNILMDIPVVEAKTLGLDVYRKYPQYVVTPNMLGSESVVCGLDGGNRPFIAVKVNLFDLKTEKKIAQVVEVVFKRYPYNASGANNSFHGDNYVTALSNKGDDGKKYMSGLYASGGMTNRQFARVGQLLRGKKIEHEFDKKYLMQKA